MGNESQDSVTIDPWPIRTAGQIAQEVSADICGLADEVSPASSLASQNGMPIGAYLMSVVPAWEDHLRAVCQKIESIGVSLLAAADGFTFTDDDNATDIAVTTERTAG